MYYIVQILPSIEMKSERNDSNCLEWNVLFLQLTVDLKVVFLTKKKDLIEHDGKEKHTSLKWH